MKLTDELLTQLVNEELGRVDEKLNVPFGPPKGKHDPHQRTPETYNNIKTYLNLSLIHI